MHLANAFIQSDFQEFVSNKVSKQRLIGHNELWLYLFTGAVHIIEHHKCNCARISQYGYILGLHDYGQNDNHDYFDQYWDHD